MAVLLCPEGLTTLCLYQGSRRRKPSTEAWDGTKSKAPQAILDATEAWDRAKSVEEFVRLGYDREQACHWPKALNRLSQPALYRHR